MLAAKLSMQLILLIGQGIYAQRSGVVGGDFDRQLTSFILNIALPCLIVKSMYLTFSPEQLRGCILVLVLGLGAFAVQFALGQAGYLLTGKSPYGRIMRFGMMFSNFTFMGIPVMETLFGQEGLFYFVIFLVPIRILYYTLSGYLLAPPGEFRGHTSLKERLRDYFSPPITAVFVGLFFYLTGTRLPGVLSDVIASVGSVCSPMGMILCGISLGKYDFRSLVKFRFLLLPLLRNLLVPAVFFALTRLLPLEPMIAGILVMYAALPVASLVVAFTIRYSPGQQQESAGSVLLSTMLSAFTIPMWAYILAL